jgi:putative transposase
MDGKGRYLDNILIERLWRTLKYECVYLHAWETGSQARAGVRKWMEFYNHRRPHKALGGRPPAVVYSLRLEATQPDQQEQIRAWKTPDPVQGMGSTSKFTVATRAIAERKNLGLRLQRVATCLQSFRRSNRISIRLRFR